MPFSTTAADPRLDDLVLDPDAPTTGITRGLAHLGFPADRHAAPQTIPLPVNSLADYRDRLNAAKAGPEAAERRVGVDWADEAAFAAAVVVPVPPGRVWGGTFDPENPDPAVGVLRSPRNSPANVDAILARLRTALLADPDFRVDERRAAGASVWLVIAVV